MGVNVGTMTTGTEPLLSSDYLYLYRSGSAAGSRARKFAADALVTKTASQTLTNKVLTAATITTSLTPTTNDGAALGSSALKFSDLFLASGAVINFNSGNITLTHSAGDLANNGTFTATGYKVSSNAVVGARKTGWGTPAGTLDRTAYTSYAGQTVSAGYVQAEAQATDTAVRNLARVVAALLTDLHGASSGHGLIGT